MDDAFMGAQRGREEVSVNAGTVPAGKALAQPQSPQRTVMGLQLTAGNRAVSRLVLARDPHVHYSAGERDRSRRAQGLAVETPGPGLPHQVYMANFPPGSATLGSDQRRELDHLLRDAHLATRGRVVRIVGFTDAVDTNEVNVALRQGRADAIRAYLIAGGVPESRIGPATGAPIEQYLRANSSEFERSVNRGAVITLSQDWAPPPLPPPHLHPPPPPRAPTPACTTRSFRIRMVAQLGGGDGWDVEGITFEIADPDHNQLQTYGYAGAGIGAGADVPGNWVPRGWGGSIPGGVTAPGPWNDFQTRLAMCVDGFAGVTRFTTIGIGPCSVNILTMCGMHPVDCLTEPKSLHINTGWTIGAGASTTMGSLTRIGDVRNGPSD